jgi:hypothetical protein
MRYIYTVAAVLTGAAALAMSWWSIYSLGRYLGIPVLLAASLSSVFDLAAIVLVGLSERYAAAPHAGSGAGPRLSLLLMLAGSIFLNIRHAQISGAGVTGMVAYAAPAVVAVLLVELHLRYANRETRYALGRVAPALPVLGGWAILLYPFRSLGVIRTVVQARLDRIAEEATPSPLTVNAELVPNPPVVEDQTVPSAPQQKTPEPAPAWVRRAPARAPDTQNMLGADAINNTGAFRVVTTEDQA